MTKLISVCGVLVLGIGLIGCTSTQITESPRTAYVSDVEEPKEPDIIWTSRTLNRPFGYLGQIEVRSWTYNGALDRLVEGAKKLRADAIIDVYYHQVGFLKTMHAFAIKYE